MMNLIFGLFTQVSGSGPLGPLVFIFETHKRPRARYGLPPPPVCVFVDHAFFRAQCLRSILQHVSPLKVGA